MSKLLRFSTWFFPVWALLSFTMVLISMRFSYVYPDYAIPLAVISSYAAAAMSAGINTCLTYFGYYLKVKGHDKRAYFSYVVMVTLFYLGLIGYSPNNFIFFFYGFIGSGLLTILAFFAMRSELMSHKPAWEERRRLEALGNFNMEVTHLKNCDNLTDETRLALEKVVAHVQSLKTPELINIYTEEVFDARKGLNALTGLHVTANHITMEAEEQASKQQTA